MIYDPAARLAVEIYKITIQGGHSPDAAVQAAERMLGILDRTRVPEGRRLPDRPGRLNLSISMAQAPTGPAPAATPSPLKAGPLSEDEAAEALRLSDAGESVSDIARALGRDPRGFYGYITKAQKERREKLAAEQAPATPAVDKLAAAREAIAEEAEKKPAPPTTFRTGPLSDEERAEALRLDREGRAPRAIARALNRSPVGFSEMMQALRAAAARAKGGGTVAIPGESDADLVARHAAEKGITRVEPGHAPNTHIAVGLDMSL